MLLTFDFLSHLMKKREHNSRKKECSSSIGGTKRVCLGIQYLNIEVDLANRTVKENLLIGGGMGGIFLFFWTE